MSPRTVEEPSVGRLRSELQEDRTGDLERRIRQRMRLHPLIRAIRKFGPLPKTARTLGRYAGLASQFWRQLFARQKLN
jgi:hypothetical protein